MAESFKLEPGATIWVLPYHGMPERLIFQAHYPAHKKVLVERNGAPEVIDEGSCFTTKIACCAEAIARAQRAATEAMDRSARCVRMMHEEESE